MIRFYEKVGIRKKFGKDCQSEKLSSKNLTKDETKMKVTFDDDSKAYLKRAV